MVLRDMFMFEHILVVGRLSQSLPVRRDMFMCMGETGSGKTFAITGSAERYVYVYG